MKERTFTSQFESSWQMITTRALHVRNNPGNKILVEMVWQKEVYNIAKRILVFSVTDKKYGLVRKAKNYYTGESKCDKQSP